MLAGPSLRLPASPPFVPLPRKLLGRYYPPKRCESDRDEQETSSAEDSDGSGSVALKQRLRSATSGKRPLTYVDMLESEQSPTAGEPGPRTRSSKRYRKASSSEDEDEDQYVYVPVSMNIFGNSERQTNDISFRSVTDAGVKGWSAMSRDWDSVPAPHARTKNIGVRRTGDKIVPSEGVPLLSRTTRRKNLKKSRLPIGCAPRLNHFVSPPNQNYIMMVSQV